MNTYEDFRGVSWICLLMGYPYGLRLVPGRTDLHKLGRLTVFRNLHDVLGDLGTSQGENFRPKYYFRVIRVTRCLRQRNHAPGVKLEPYVYSDQLSIYTVYTLV